MIDIHNHSLYGVDDGAKTVAESQKMLRYASEIGITDIVLTPHYRHGMFPYPKQKIEEHFEILKGIAGYVGVNVYLGCEYHVDCMLIDHLDAGDIYSLAEEGTVLTEYSYETEYEYIRRNSQQLLSHGYVPVIAHVERYGCFLKKPALLNELSEMGAMIQVNADGILGTVSRREKKFCKNLLKEGLVDVVASDTHDMGNRINNMKSCMEYVEKKYGNKMAEKLFIKNPERIIRGEI